MERREFIETIGAGALALAATSCKKAVGATADDAEMAYRTMPGSGDRVSLLGYGCMRWPLLEDKTVDQEAVNELVDYAIAHGVNYFDTSPRYLRGTSEAVTANALARHPRESYYIATKLSNFDPASRTFEASKKMFEDSLANFHTDYIDYYLLHSVGGGMGNFRDRFIDNGILDWVVEQKRLGRIRHLGFSYHGGNDDFDRLMAMHDKGEYTWDFVQIQMNYLEWEDDDKKNDDCAYFFKELAKRNIPVVIMEPLLGGALAKVGDGIVTRLKQRDPSASVASWAFRFCGSFPEVLTVLSGMTYMEHLKDNLETFCGFEPLDEEGLGFLADTAKQIRDFPTVPCTACQYCMPCPYGIDIPSIFAHYNKCVNEDHIPASSKSEGYDKARRAFLVGYDRSVPKLRQAAHCIGCRQCETKCPQKIKISDELHKIDRYVEKLKQNKI